jgi:CIC family chloride channel protein
LLLALKIPATAMCYSSGNAGGIFGPSLFIGAMLGGAVGSLANLALPGLTAGPGAYAMIGMGAAFAGIIRTPLTSVIMIFELTRDYTIIVPLMIANLVSFFVSHRLQKEPVYDALAHQDGVHLPQPGHQRAPERVGAGQVMRTSGPFCTSGDSVADALQKLNDANATALPILEDSRLQGFVRRSDIDNLMATPSSNASVADVRIMAPSGGQRFPHVHPDHDLGVVLGRMSSYGLNVLPVVNRLDVHQVLGIVTEEDVLRSLRDHSGLGAAS